MNQNLSIIFSKICKSNSQNDTIPPPPKTEEDDGRPVYVV